MDADSGSPSSSDQRITSREPESSEQSQPIGTCAASGNRLFSSACKDAASWDDAAGRTKAKNLLSATSSVAVSSAIFPVSGTSTVRCCYSS